MLRSKCRDLDAKWTSFSEKYISMHSTSPHECCTWVMVKSITECPNGTTFNVLFAPGIPDFSNNQNSFNIVVLHINLKIKMLEIQK